MSHVFEGQPDGRQSTDTELKPSRFRPVFKALTLEKKQLHDNIKAKAAELEALFGQVPDGEYAHDAMRALEVAVMWKIKDLTA